MSVVYLNGDYLPMQEAKISPMDRGFLFGDGVYEVVPSYGGKLVGFGPHIQRLRRNLAAIELTLDWSEADWRNLAESLLQKNGASNLGLYFHVSRGADSRRFHAYPAGLEPTVFAFAFEITEPKPGDKAQVRGIKVKSCLDLRWKRCHIKSTSLLGHVMHFQHGFSEGAQETLLFNDQEQLTEASACNVFIVKNDIVSTPSLDNQLLPGITRMMLIDMLKKQGVVEVQERVIHMQEVRSADEIWLTSSRNEVDPVIELDGEPVGTGQVGDMWQLAQGLFNAHKFDY